jgi:hypothetical protein
MEVDAFQLNSENAMHCPSCIGAEAARELLSSLTTNGKVNHEACLDEMDRSPQSGSYLGCVLVLDRLER